MNGSRRLASLLVCLPALLVLAPFSPRQSTSPAPSGLGSKTWVGRYHEVEEYLRTAECVVMEDIGASKNSQGVPALKRCVLRPGGPVSRMAWKSPPPGGYRGFRESYKTEIAAYELDKLLKMDMVPPSVERELQGHKGAATFWVEDVVDLRAGTSPGASDRAHWDKQQVRMTMFANLIGDKDRNRGNMLRDAAWNLILIDHSRAFGLDTELPHNMSRIDEDHWDKIERLTRKQLDATLRPWLDDEQISAIMARREKMRVAIARRPK